jgi:hypothetical protein
MRRLIGAAALFISILALIVAIVGVIVAPMLIVAAYVIARLRLSIDRPGEDERWLLYPPLFLGTAGIVLVILFWPLALAIVLGSLPGFVDYYPDFFGAAPAAGSFGYWFNIFASAALITGGWLILLGTVLPARPSAMRRVLHPFAQRGIPAFVHALTPLGIVLAIAGAAWLLFQGL